MGDDGCSILNEQGRAIQNGTPNPLLEVRRGCVRFYFGEADSNEGLGGHLSPNEPDID